MSEESERLLLAVESAGVGIWDYHPGSRQLICSPRCKELFGIAPDKEVTYRDFIRLLHPDDRERTDQLVQQAMSAGSDGTYDTEYRPLHQPGGRERWLRATGRAFLDENNQLLRFIGTVYDISQQKEISLRQQESEQRFRLLADSAPVLIWMSGLDKGCTFFNSSWLRFTGRPLEQELGHGWRDRIHPADKLRCLTLYQHSFDLRKPFQMEFRLLRHDRTYRWVIDTGTPLYEQDGTFSGYIGSCIDVHDLKATEEALREQEAQFSVLAEHIPQLVWMADGEGHVFWYNQRWYDFTGTTLEEMQGWGWQKVHHPDHIGRVTEHWKKSIMTGLAWEDTFPLRSKTGQYRWFLTRAVPIYDEDGQVARWFGSNTDITEQRQLQEQLQRSLEDLELKVKFRTLSLERQNQQLQDRLQTLESCPQPGQ